MTAQKQLRKRGYHWFNLLTKKQKKQYFHNTKNNKYLEGTTFESYINFKKNNTSTAWSFIKGSFVASETKEGEDYWDAVIERLNNK